MSRGRPGELTAGAPAPGWRGLLAGVVVVALGAGVGRLGFDRWRIAPSPSPPEARAEGAAGPTRARALGAGRAVDAPDLQAPTPDDDPPELTPWDRRPDNTPPLPPDQVPAWEVQPPPPDLPPLPPPVEPPDPLEYEPPRDNPNGVDGERGPRSPA